LFPANAVGDDIEVYSDEQRTHVLQTFHFLRQQRQKSNVNEPYYCLADFVAPKSSSKIDYLGGFAVSAGSGVEELAKEYEAQHDDYSAILTKALGDRIAEALAELMHKKVRMVCGYE